MSVFSTGLVADIGLTPAETVDWHRIGAMTGTAWAVGPTGLGGAMGAVAGPESFGATSGAGGASDVLEGGGMSRL